jgi:serine/threonine protein phosphatase PrpC
VARASSLELAYAKASAANRATEDRAEVFERAGALVVVVADGAGGMRGGSTASDAVVEAVRACLASSEIDPTDTRVWSRVLEAADSALAVALSGETTAVVVVLGAHGIVGVSAGDSEAWVVSDGAIDRLTEAQTTKRIGTAAPSWQRSSGLASKARSSSGPTACSSTSPRNRSPLAVPAS